MICYTYVLQKDDQDKWTPITLHSTIFFLVKTTFKITLSNFQMPDMVSLALVTMLHNHSRKYSTGFIFCFVLPFSSFPLPSSVFPLLSSPFILSILSPLLLSFLFLYCSLSFIFFFTWPRTRNFPKYWQRNSEWKRHGSFLRELRILHGKLLIKWVCFLQHPKSYHRARVGHDCTAVERTLVQNKRELITQGLQNCFTFVCIYVSVYKCGNNTLCLMVSQDSQV